MTTTISQIYIINKIKSALGNWSSCYWPIYVNSGVDEALKCAESAIEAIRKLDFNKAREALKKAVAIEEKYGDSPVYSRPLQYLEDFMDQVITIKICVEEEALQTGFCCCMDCVNGYIQQLEKATEEVAEETGLNIEFQPVSNVLEEADIWTDWFVLTLIRKIFDKVEFKESHETRKEETE